MSILLHNKSSLSLFCLFFVHYDQIALAQLDTFHTPVHILACRLFQHIC